MTPSSPPPGCLNRPDDVLVQGANGVCGVPAALAQAGQPLPRSTWLAGSLTVAAAFLLLRRGSRAPARAALVGAGLVVSSAAGYAMVFGDRADAPARMTALAQAESPTTVAMERLAAGSTGCMRLPSACVGCEAVLHYASPTGRLCGRRLAGLGAGASPSTCPPGAKCPEAHVSDAPRVP